MKRFMVAKSDWHAKQVLKKIYRGRIEREAVDRVLMTENETALRRIKAMPFGVQELYSIYQVEFDPSKIDLPVTRYQGASAPSNWE